jgi:RNA polymerase sigma-70 factor (ECF subfamily)
VFLWEFGVEPDDRFAQLVAPVKRRMFETVWRILRHAQDAEDALQVALTTIWRQRQRIECHAAPQALMLKICADAAIDQYRRRGNDLARAVALEDDIPSAQPLPVEAAIDNETHEILIEAISRLSPNQATAITMRFIQGESDAFFAAALGCALETVREHLDRGRERLGRMLGRLGHGHDVPANSATVDLHSENNS